MDAERSDCLLRAAKQFGTPLYIYFIDDVLDRLKMLEHLFGGRFSVSFAVKSNPNKAILRHLLGHVGSYDVSSFAEVERVLLAGCRAQEITFSGPGKRDDELRRSVMAGVGELVCESLEEAVRVDSYARDLGANVDILVRLNPLRIPKDFGVNMAGRPTQFGIDEEAMMPVLESCARLQNARLVGIHIYSGTNCLSAHAIAENFSIFLELFDRRIDALAVFFKHLRHHLRGQRLVGHKDQRLDNSNYFGDRSWFVFVFRIHKSNIHHRVTECTEVKRQKP